MVTTRTVAMPCIEAPSQVPWLLRRKIAPCYHTLDVGGAQAPTATEARAAGLLNSHPVNRSVDFCRFCEIALVGLKTHIIGVAATALAQWCTSWSPKLMPLVQTPGVHPRGITYLLAAGLIGVRTPRTPT